MKFYFIAVALFISLFTVAQKGNGKITIVGKLTNCKDTIIWLQRSIMNDASFKEKITVNKHGYFSYTTKNIKEPLQATITNYRKICIPVYLAPTYNMQIAGDVEDLANTLTYSGIGASSNKFEKVYHLIFSRKVPEWIDTTEKSFISNPYFKTNWDSIINKIKLTIFGASNKDPYKEHFEYAAITSIKYRPLLSILYYSVNNELDAGQTTVLINKLFDTTILNGLNNKENLMSDIFIECMYGYIDYLILKRPSPLPDPFYSVKIIDEIFSGNVRDYFLYTFLSREIAKAAEKPELEGIKKYLSLVKTQDYKKLLNIQYNILDAKLSGLYIGAIAPWIAIYDNEGRPFNVDTLKNKVVCIEFWGSWCGPCQQELPYLKELYKKFKENSQFILISIAVNDKKGKEKRLKIIKDLSLQWQQLEDDDNDAMAKLYNVVYFPRLILIGKNGKILSLNTPLPSDENKLESLISKALEQN